MKIVQDKTTGRIPKEVSIATAIAGTIDTSFSEGSVERIVDRVRSCSDILCKLVQALHENKHLTDDQVADMLGYRYSVEE